jgi:hypothetical protein
MILVPEGGVDQYGDRAANHLELEPIRNEERLLARVDQVGTRQLLTWKIERQKLGDLGACDSRCDFEA